MTQKDLSGRLARWSLRLQRYDFGIEHRTGALNIVPDCLSRVHVEELTLTNLRFEIDLSSPEFEGDEYRQLRKTITENKESLLDLCIANNLVLKRVDFRQGAKDEEDSLWCLWIPISLTQSAIK